MKKEGIPVSKMREISGSGIFIKRFSGYGKTEMKPYAHRDDYFIFVLLTEGSAAVEVDFERKLLKAGDMLIISPWQVHKKPIDEEWKADGWMLAISPEILSEAEIHAIEQYSVGALQFSPGEIATGDIICLCSMLERNIGNKDVATSLAASVKSFAISSIGNSINSKTGRYNTITYRLNKLLDARLPEEKSPAAYASMLNISEVYLNEAVKSVTGLNAGTFIRRRAIIMAMRQLAYTSLSSKEIACSLGYDDYAYFSKLFKKYSGKSPADYRKNLK